MNCPNCQSTNIKRYRLTPKLRYKCADCKKTFTIESKGIGRPEGTTKDKTLNPCPGCGKVKQHFCLGFCQACYRNTKRNENLIK